MTDIVFESPRTLSQWLQTRRISALELLDAFVARIEQVNTIVNAIVTLDLDHARNQARAIDHLRARSETLGPFAGLPMAMKDMERTAGMRTTFGSPIFKDFVPSEDGYMVERLKRHGIVIFGKTNTPEFAMGSQTFNTVFGATKNPWALDKTCGGSSGGAAVGVVTGMLPFADGSDLGASVRNPANFNNLVGLRTCPGRVPAGPSADAWMGTATIGPIARTASDAAFLLAAMAGDDARTPLGISEDPRRFLEPLERDFKGTRVAFSASLGGLPVDAHVAKVLRDGIKHFEALGCVIEEAEPDLAGADECFDVQRALLLAQTWGHLLPKHRGQMKDTAIWNIEEAARLTPAQVMRANTLRTTLFTRLREFLTGYEFLVCPVNQVPPFAIDQPYVTEINGVKMANYIDWMRTCTRITVTSHPAASVPCGFTPQGLPVGMQIVGRYRGEFGVLQLAHALEQVNPLHRRRPLLR